MSLLRDLGLWLWRLLPANPILVRVVSMGSKRRRHLWVRLVYLLALTVMFLVAGRLLLLTGQRSLAELAKQATQVYVGVSIMQLLLMCFVAPVFCAAAITQEKDANTYHILLTTPLSNAQIVLGSLLSRLTFVWALLLSGLPIFCITMIYGGVTTTEILESFGLAATTALLTGSIAVTISFLRIGTRRTIFTFFLAIAVYLLGGYLLGGSTWGQLAIAPQAPPSIAGYSTERMSWLAAAHPFLALRVVTGQTPAPAWSDVASMGWPQSWLMAWPQYGYMALTALASAVMVLISLVCVRRGAREGESSLLRRIGRWLVPKKIGERRRKPRRVWRNPIAWREATTRASAGGRSLLRLLFMVAGFAVGVVLVIAHYDAWWGLQPTAPQNTRYWLIALVWIEAAAVLLVVTTTAATTFTREKESLTMELLTSTPLTSRYIVAGMIQGLVRLVVPLVGVTAATLLLVFLAGCFWYQSPPVISPESVIIVPALVLAFASLAAVVGLYLSLVSRKTVQAVMVSTGVVLGAAGLLHLCSGMASSGGTSLIGLVHPFTPFAAIATVIDPWSVVDSAGTSTSYYRATMSASEEVASLRVTLAVGAAVAVATYLGITYALHRSMVRGYDMTIRRQSA